MVVRFQNEQVARATANAFVTAVHVRRGERVGKGQLLMELSDPELSLEQQKLEDDASLAQQRAIQYRRRGEIAKANAESENAQSIRRQLAELNEQVKGLRVIAKRDGLVTSSAPERLLGQYANKGDELVRVSDPNEKELLAIIHETDMDAYQSAADTGSISSVRLRGGTKFKTHPIALRPRARRSLPHPSLAASFGGPVAVEPSSEPDQQLQMIEPQLESITPLDPLTSLRTRAGQVGTMTISDDRSLVTRILDNLLETP